MVLAEPRARPHAGRSAASPPSPIQLRRCRASSGHEEEGSGRAAGSQLHRQQQVGGQPPREEPAGEETNQKIPRRESWGCGQRAGARGRVFGVWERSGKGAARGEKLRVRSLSVTSGLLGLLGMCLCVWLPVCVSGCGPKEPARGWGCRRGLPCSLPQGVPSYEGWRPPRSGGAGHPLAPSPWIRRALTGSIPPTTTKKGATRARWGTASPPWCTTTTRPTGAPRPKAPTRLRAATSSKCW